MRVRFLLLVSAAIACGCAGQQDFQYNRIQRQRADTAWRDTFGSYNRELSTDYRDGWKAGYYDLSRGQCDELPPVPPHKYWSASFQSADGQARIEQWYCGWRDGADAAKACNTPEWHRIAPAPTAPSPAENAALSLNARNTLPVKQETQLARKPKVSLPAPQVPQAVEVPQPVEMPHIPEVPMFRPAAPLPEEVEVAPPGFQDESEMVPVPVPSIQPVAVDASEHLDDNYAAPVPVAADEPVGEGVE